MVSEVVSYPAKSSWYNEQKIQATVLGHIPPLTWPLYNRILVCYNIEHVMDAYNNTYVIKLIMPCQIQEIFMFLEAITKDVNKTQTGSSRFSVQSLTREILWPEV